MVKEEVLPPGETCFMDSHDNCSALAKKWSLLRFDGSVEQSMNACDKHFHQVWAGEN